MFATLAGGYPFSPLPGATRDFGAARDAASAGTIREAALAAEADLHVRAIVREQAVAGLDLVEDAWARFPPRPTVEGVTALAAALLEGTLDAARVAEAWRALAAATDTSGLVTKVVLPGPCTLTALASSAGVGDAARALALELVRGCMEALVAADCPVVVFAEPELSRIDGARATWSHAAAMLTAAIEPGADAMHVGVALTGGAIDPAGDAVLAALPIASLLVDVTIGPAAWRTIGAQPAERGIIVGACDARSGTLDDSEMLLWAGTLAAEHAARGHVRVGIAPSGSLAGIDRHHARRKIERLGEAVRLSAMGPISEVARALQPDPGRGRIGSLRRLIADHDAVLPAIDRPRSPA